MFAIALLIWYVPTFSVFPIDQFGRLYIPSGVDVFNVNMSVSLEICGWERKWERKSKVGKNAQGGKLCEFDH